jgi:hypothetical protein
MGDMVKNFSRIDSYRYRYTTGWVYTFDFSDDSSYMISYLIDELVREWIFTYMYS